MVQAEGNTFPESRLDCGAAGVLLAIVGAGVAVADLPPCQRYRVKIPAGAKYSGAGWKYLPGIAARLRRRGRAARDRRRRRGGRRRRPGRHHDAGLRSHPPLHTRRRLVPPPGHRPGAVVGREERLRSRVRRLPFLGRGRRGLAHRVGLHGTKLLAKLIARLVDRGGHGHRRGPGPARAAPVCLFGLRGGLIRRRVLRVRLLRCAEIILRCRGSEGLLVVDGVPSGRR